MDTRPYMLNSPFQHSATHEISYVQSVKQQPRTMVVSGKSGRFVSKLIYSKKCNYSVRSHAGLHCPRGSRDIFAQPIDFGYKIVYICAVRIFDRAIKPVAFKEIVRS